METFIHFLKKIIIKTLLCVFKIFKVKKNRIFIHNDLGYNFSCNPKYIANYLLKKYENQFEIIFSVKDVSKYENFSQKILFVKFNSLKYFYYAITSRIFITNSGGFSYLPLNRKKQVVINTWHGGGAYKKLGMDMYNNSKLYMADLRLAARSTTVFLSSCKEFTKVASRSMLLPNEIFWEIGMPRNDILFENNIEYKESIRKKLGLCETEKLVLYAPTYRKINDDYFKDSIAIDYDIDVNGVCKALKRKFGGEWKFGYRLHPCVINKDCINGENIINLSNYEEMQDLLLVADVMINDFSSSIWDFMLTGKPIFMYAKDMDHYIKTTEVYTPVEKWPFLKAIENSTLIKNILDFNEEDYSLNVKRHLDELGCTETGRATEKVCKYIEKIVKSNKIIDFKEIDKYGKY